MWLACNLEVESNMAGGISGQYGIVPRINSFVVLPALSYIAWQSRSTPPQQTSGGYILECGVQW